MKIKRDKSEFQLPEAVEEATCRLGIWSDGDPLKNPQSYLRLVQMVRLGDLIEAEESVSSEMRGAPTIFAVRHDDKHSYLRFWPIPDADYHARLIYNPARKEI